MKKKIKVIIVIYFFVFVFLFCSRSSLPYAISLRNVEIYMRNLLVISLLLSMLIIWKTVLEKGKWISKLSINDGYNDYQKANNEILESSSNRFVNNFIWSAIFVVIIRQLGGEKIEYIGLFIVLLVNISLFGFFSSQLYNGDIRDIDKDSYFWLKVWNSLCFSKEINGGLENKKYLKWWTVSLKNRTSITINDISRVRESMKELLDTEIEELLYMLYVPDYLSEFNKAVKAIGVICANFLASIYFGGILLDLLKNSVKDISNILNIFQNVNMETFFGFLIYIGIGLMVLCLIIMGFNYKTCKQKRNQVKNLMMKLIIEEGKKRGFDYIIGDLKI